MWHNICRQIPKNIFLFVRRALIYSLPNNSNYVDAGKEIIHLVKCATQTNKQTQLHMLSACAVSAAEGRYTWRHDSILYTLLHYISQLRKYGFRNYADLNNFDNPYELFYSFRPDIVLIKDDRIFILELTCCFETNSEKSRNLKINKYRDIQNDCKKRFRHWRKIFVEFTTL
jgi:hypothetical protein